MLLLVTYLSYPSESGLPGAGSVGASGTEGGVEETTMAVDVNTSWNPTVESGKYGAYCLTK